LSHVSVLGIIGHVDASSDLVEEAFHNFFLKKSGGIVVNSFIVGGTLQKLLKVAYERQTANIARFDHGESFHLV